MQVQHRMGQTKTIFRAFRASITPIRTTTGSGSPAAPRTTHLATNPATNSTTACPGRTPTPCSSHAASNRRTAACVLTRRLHGSHKATCAFRKVATFAIRMGGFFRNTYLKIYPENRELLGLRVPSCGGRLSDLSVAFHNTALAQEKIVS